MKTRKSQMEILGLAIVVVIILVAAAVFLQLSFSKKQTDYRKPFTSSKLASNMLNTYLDTTSRDCSLLTMTELLQDCGQGQGFACENGGIPQNSCDYAKSSATEIFDRTFKKWNMKYEFTVCTNFDYKKASCTPSSLLIKIPDAANSKCPGEKEFKLFPLPSAGGTIFVKLDLCL